MDYFCGIDIGSSTAKAAIVDTTGRIVATARANARNGSYDFMFENIEPGRYIVAAGSNPDNDANICESAEACGQYPSLGTAAEIIVTQESSTITNINFNTGFNRLSVTNFNFSNASQKLR